MAKGKVVQVIGPVVDIEFPAGELPEILNAVTIKGKAGDTEIDLVIEENGTLYPVEIKMTGNPKAAMASANTVLDKIPSKKRGMGVILCLCGRKTYLRENLVALPVEYL